MRALTIDRGGRLVGLCFIRMDSAERLIHPDVEALIAAAIRQAAVPWPATGRGRLVVRSVAAKQRSRRKPTS